MKLLGFSEVKIWAYWKDEWLSALNQDPLAWSYLRREDVCNCILRTGARYYVDAEESFVLCGLTRQSEAFVLSVTASNLERMCARCFKIQLPTHRKINAANVVDVGFEILTAVQRGVVRWKSDEVLTFRGHLSARFWHPENKTDKWDLS
jgi:hypothetical protein